MSEPLTKPFRALIYNKNMIDDISSCVCPPYDVITDRRVYLDKSIFNAIRLELPVSEPPMDEYEAAKNILERWLGEKIIVYDKKETIYIYEQEFQFDGSPYLRRGFLSLNKLDKDRILIHEATRVKAKKDRERLISTLKTYTSFIFGLYKDEENIIEDALINSEKEILFEFTDEQSIKNRFYRMTNKKEINMLSGLMGGKNIYIADGHHRLDVSYRLGMEYVPIYLTNMYSKGIVILPYHRVIKFKKNRPLVDILNILKRYMSIETVYLKDDKSVKKALNSIASSAVPSYIMYSKDDTHSMFIMKEKKPIRFREQVHDVLKRLKVNILHAGILNNLINIEEDEISFTQETLEAIQLLKKGRIDLLFLLPPTTVDEVKDIAENSLYMPPKSTFFYPKIPTGPLFYRYG